MCKASVVIIGGGASGLMAAIIAAREGSRVTLLEHMDRVGKKLLSTGNGKCNFTNLNQDISNYHGESTTFIQGILQQFDYLQTIKFFEELGIVTKSKNGYVYPNSGQASSVLDLLRQEVSRLGITLVCDVAINNIEKTKKAFKVSCNKGIFNADSIVLATGSKAAPVTGSDGSGYNYAKGFGHKINKVLPSLVQLKCKEKYYKTVAGVRTDAKVSLLVDNNYVASDIGELQLTDYGISGIPVFQISRYAAIALSEKKNVSALINFFPDHNKASMEEYLIKRFEIHKEKRLEDALIGMLNKKLIIMLIKESGLSLDCLCSSLCNKDISMLADSFTGLRTIITETNSFDKAQVCTGGVSLSDINPETLESYIVPGLYFAGEILDVDGACGGYNLQWAWSSGYVSGKNAAYK